MISWNVCRRGATGETTRAAATQSAFHRIIEEAPRRISLFKALQIDHHLLSHTWMYLPCPSHTFAFIPLHPALHTDPWINPIPTSASVTFPLPPFLPFSSPPLLLSFTHNSQEGRGVRVCRSHPASCCFLLLFLSPVDKLVFIAYGVHVL